MPSIAIEWITDSHDCDDCGPSYSEGAIIRIDGMEEIDLSPAAHCYDGTHYTREEVYRRVLNALGYDVTETDSSTGEDEWDT